MERVDCIVIGAGIIGIAVARALAMKGREVLILEKAPSIGTETSSRNSEVIHAGIYYPKNSLKAKTCVEGKKALYQFCQERGIPHQKIGKLIVATNKDQIYALQKIKQLAEENGVNDLKYLNSQEAINFEPNLYCTGALFSPSTGIIDTHALMLALQGEAEAHRAQFIFQTEILGGEVKESGIELEISGFKLQCKTLINAAGLWAQSVAKSLKGFPEETIPSSYFAKGSYFSYSGKSPFQRLIYPIPEQGGLGIHMTVDLANKARFGPDVEWITKIDYKISTENISKFYFEIRKYWPALPEMSLFPDYTGIRPKLIGPQGNKVADFSIHGAETHGLSSIINLYGIESPGITSSLALAEHVACLAQNQLTYKF